MINFKKILSFTLIFVLSSFTGYTFENSLEVRFEKRYNDDYIRLNRKRNLKKAQPKKDEKKDSDATWFGVQDIVGKSTHRMKQKVYYPDYELRQRNLMRPAPISNTMQIYPFISSIPMKGGDILAKREVEFSLLQNYITGKQKGSSSVYQVDMDHWYFEQTLGLSIGLTEKTEISTSIPLYHFKGDSTFTKHGFEMIGLKGKARHYWGGPSLSVKRLLYQKNNNKYLADFWFQFPEGNQREHGGSTSGHWALNAIYEKVYEDRRYQLNLGLVEAGDLKLMNGQTLKQQQAYFLAAAFTKKFAPTVAAEVQWHSARTALAYTGIDDYKDWYHYMSIGARKHYHGLESSISLVGGIKDLPTVGVTLDLKYLW